MMDIEALPGSAHAWPDDAADWLRSLGCAASDIQETLVSAPPFSPATLKQVLTAVMDLGRRAGRLGEVMALLGHQEAALRRLRDDVGIPRAAPPSDLVAAAVIVRTPSGWRAPGGWVPDLLDRAASRDVLCQPGSAPRSVDPVLLEAAGIHHLFLMTAGEEEEGLSGIDVSGAIIHRVAAPADWLQPGPRLAHAIFDAASRMHGISAVFF